MLLKNIFAKNLMAHQAYLRNKILILDLTAENYLYTKFYLMSNEVNHSGIIIALLKKDLLNVNFSEV